MAGRISSLVGSIAFVATLISGVPVPNTARADNCITAPNASAPEGSHWYFRLDWKTQHKCWYTRAPSQPAQHATAHATSEAPPAAQSHSVLGSTPHTPILPQQPKPGPAVSTTPQRRNSRDVDAGNVRSAIKHVAAEAKMYAPAPASAAASPGTSPPVSTTTERRNHRAVDAGNVRSAIKHVAADAKMDGPAPAPAAASPGTSPAVSTTMERRNHRALDAGNVRSAIKHVAADAKMAGPAPAPSAASPSTSPAVSATDKVVQQSGHQGIAAPSMLETSAPQSSTSPRRGAEMGGLAPAPAAASLGTPPAVSTTTDKVVQQSGQEGIAAPSMLETSAPQSSTSPQPGAKMAGLAPAPAAASPGTLPAVSTTTDKVVQQSGHEGIAAPSMLGTSAPQSSTSPQTGAEMDGLAPAPAAASPGTLPAVSTTTDKVVQQSGHERIAAPSMLETSAPQSSTSPQTGAEIEGLAPAPAAASPGTPPAVSATTDKVVQQSGHQGIAVPSMLETSAPQSSTSPQTGAEIEGLAPAPAAASPGTLPAVGTTTDKVVQQSGHQGIAVPSMLETSAPQSSTSPQPGAEMDGLAPARAASPGTLPAVSTTTDKVVQQSGHQGIAVPSMLETSAPQSSTSPQPGAKMAGLAPAPAAASPGTLPAVSTTTDKVVQQSGHEGITAPSMLGTSAPQSSTSPQTGAEMDGLAPAPAAASPGTPPAVSATTDKVVQQSGHQGIAVPSMLETSALQSSTSPQPGAKMAGLAPAPAAASPGTLPAVSTTTDKVVQQSGHEGIAVPSMLETSAPQSSTSPQTGAKMAGLAPAPAAASPGTLPAVTTLKAPQRIVVPTDAPADSVRSNADALASDDADSTGRDREPTTNPGMAGFLRLTPKMLLIFALGLAVLGTLSRIVIKIAATRARVDERQGHHSPISTTRDYGPRQLSRAADERQDSARNNRAIGGDDKLAQLVQELVVSICRS